MKDIPKQTNDEKRTPHPKEIEEYQLLRRNAVMCQNISAMEQELDDLRATQRGLVRQIASVQNELMKLFPSKPAPAEDKNNPFVPAGSE